MPGQVVIGNVGQVFLHVVDHALSHRLAQVVFELGQHAGRRNQHQIVELPAAVLHIDLLGHQIDEVLLGRILQIAAGFDGGPSNRALRCRNPTERERHWIHQETTWD